MTHGLRTCRALGIGLGLVLSGLSGCTTPEKKPVQSTRPVGPATAGGGTTPGQTQAYNRTAPAAGQFNNVTPASANLPSVLPGSPNTSSFNSPNAFEQGNMPMRGYTPGMSVSPPAINPAQMSPQSMVPGVTSQSSANYQSPSQAAGDYRLTASTPASGMTGIKPISQSVAGLPQSPPPMELDAGPRPPLPPNGQSMGMPLASGFDSPAPPAPPAGMRLPN